MLAALVSQLWPYLIAAGTAVAAIAVAYFKGQSSATAKERLKAAKREIAAKDEQLEMMREATEEERKIAAMTDEQARNEALRWARR
ncbi:MAG: hypothetical protein QMD99_22890 [Rhizobiaceae bacterium]|nr:hypothetical protein [Desulfitobacteriaceae bacterium]MDI6838549.1 hypothetical protein [Rhizobiaceae bacterium]